MERMCAVQAGTPCSCLVELAIVKQHDILISASLRRISVRSVLTIKEDRHSSLPLSRRLPSTGAEWDQK